MEAVWNGVESYDLKLSARLLIAPEWHLTNWSPAHLPGLAAAYNPTGSGDYPMFPLLLLNRWTPHFPYGWAVEPDLP